MKVVHEFTIKCSIFHDLENLEGIKGAREFAENVGQMICDEATYSDGIATYDILDARVDIAILNNDKSNKENETNVVFKKMYDKFCKIH